MAERLGENDGVPGVDGYVDDQRRTGADVYVTGAFEIGLVTSRNANKSCAGGHIHQGNGRVDKCCENFAVRGLVVIGRVPPRSGRATVQRDLVAARTIHREGGQQMLRAFPGQGEHDPHDRQVEDQPVENRVGVLGVENGPCRVRVFAGIVVRTQRWRQFLLVHSMPLVAPRDHVLQVFLRYDLSEDEKSV